MLQSKPPTSAALINVSIINFRTVDLSIQCVQSVLDDMRDLDCIITVVDNASGDESTQILSEWITTLPQPERVQLIASPTNTGFSGGHNMGMAACEAEYHLILNSDAVLKPGFLRNILLAADRNPEFGLFTPRIDYNDGKQQISCFRFPSAFSELIRGAATGPVTRLFRRHDMPLQNPPFQDQVEWASFACIMLRDSMVKQVGPMDEGYFLYFEDVEYCWRARQAGWRICLVPNACAVHFRGGSGPVKAAQMALNRLPAYFYASRTRIFYQMNGYIGLVFANLMWSLGRAIAQFRRLVGKPVPAANQHEARDIWTNFTCPLGDRRATDT